MKNGIKSPTMKIVEPDNENIFFCKKNLYTILTSIHGTKPHVQGVLLLAEKNDIK